MRLNEFTNDDLSEGVAGPKNCWPGHRKVGTQPGTGKNAGQRVNDCEKIKKEGVAEGSGDKKPYPKTWHDVDPKIGKLVDKMSPEEKVNKGYSNPSILKKKKEQGVAEGQGSIVDKCASLAAKYFNSAGLQQQYDIDEFIKINTGDNVVVDKCASLAAKYFNSAGLQQQYDIGEYIKANVKQGVAEAGTLDRYRDRLGTTNNLQNQNDRHQDSQQRRHDRNQDWLDANHQSSLNRFKDREKMDAARTQHEIDVLAHRLSRMQRDDDDWEKTFDMMRDRINRYQWSSQRDVNPEQLAAISNIKYEPKNESAQAKTNDELLAYYAQRKAEKEKQGTSKGGQVHGQPEWQKPRVPSSTFTPGKPLPQSLQQKLDGKTNTGRAVEAKADPTGSWVVYNGSKVVRFKTHNGAKVYAEKNGGQVASGEYYHDKIAKKDVAEDQQENVNENELSRLRKLSGISIIKEEIEQQFNLIEEMVEALAEQHGVDAEQIWEDFESVDDYELLHESAAWQTSKGKSKSGGLNAKGVASYRRENPGSKLQMAVTTKPSKLKKGSKAAKRRKSFCARMSGVNGPMKKPNGKPTRKALALRKWNC